MVRKYVPRKSYQPSLEEACLEIGITHDDLAHRENRTLVKKRALKWLYRAAFHAYGTLNAFIEFYPWKDRKYFRPTLKDLALIFENDLNKQGNEEKLEAVLTAVAHAGNIFNNTTHLLPPKAMKAVLEARDICDEAVKQPSFR